MQRMTAERLASSRLFSACAAATTNVQAVQQHQLAAGEHQWLFSQPSNPATLDPAADYAVHITLDPGTAAHDPTCPDY